MPEQNAEQLLTATGLQRTVDERCLWRGISLKVRRGDIWFIRGPSGVGKTLLLRALACLDPLEAGSLALQGKTPSELGVPCWRAEVMYVHQQRVAYPGTPAQLFERVRGFASQAGRPCGDLAALVGRLGLEAGVLEQPWSQLSGGQAQRVSLALSIALRPKVLLLDEPTSACDHESSLRVEAVLQQAAMSAAVVWVTHDDAQPQRVGGKVLLLPTGAVGSVSRQGGSGGAPASSSSSSDVSLMDRSATWAGPAPGSYGSFVRRQEEAAAATATLST